MRYLGALLLVLAGGAVGLAKTGALRRKIVVLEELSALGALICAEMRQRGTPLPDILDGWKSNILPLQTWSGQLREGKTALAVMSPWLETLDAGERRVMTELCAVLGRYDGETQAAACEQTCLQLNRQADSLRRQLSEKGRLYHTVPFTLGLMAALALL